ncbi:MAG: CatB-related O-acetyltransferase [Acetobacteraceae bacterium]
MLIKLTQTLKDGLKERGIESFHAPGVVNLSSLAVFEPPCSIKWMSIENNLFLGAFSYAVSGYFSEVSIGRYVSIGEAVQIGRANHAMHWISTSPFFYNRQKLFQIGNHFPDAERYHGFVPPKPGASPPTAVKTIRIGNDVWIGHGAFIRPGVTVGDGAVIGAYAVVTKDVPPYGVVAGNPATLKRIRLAPKVVAAMLDVQWWRFAPWQLEGVDFSDPERAVDLLRAVAERAAPYEPPPVRVRDMPT